MNDVVGINRAGLTFFRRDPGSVYIIISDVYLAPFRTAAFIQPCRSSSIILGSGQHGSLASCSPTYRNGHKPNGIWCRQC
jgi:hypothetical protein